VLSPSAPSAQRDREPLVGEQEGDSRTHRACPNHHGRVSHAQPSARVDPGQGSAIACACPPLLEVCRDSLGDQADLLRVVGHWPEDQVLEAGLHEIGDPGVDPIDPKEHLRSEAEFFNPLQLEETARRLVIRLKRLSFPVALQSPSSGYVHVGIRVGAG
jgi:hypothetical protein